MATTLCFDFGNTRMKCGVFSDGAFVEELVLENDSEETIRALLDKYHPDRSILSSVIHHNPRLEVLLQEAEVVAIELDPECFALQVLQPARTKIAVPVVLDPVANGSLAKIVAHLLALNPFEAVDFSLAFGPDTELDHDPSSAKPSRGPGGAHSLSANPEDFVRESLRPS